MGTKRPRQADGEAADAPPATDVVGYDVASAKEAYKRAKKAYKDDKSNDELKRARDEAKARLKQAEEAASAGATDSTSAANNGGDEAMTVQSEQAATEDPNETNAADADDPADGSAAGLPSLEAAYRTALAAYKSDKSNKDLRRARTAARRALDAALAASADGDLLACTDCSQRFLFSSVDKAKHAGRGWTEPPKRCGKCRDVRAERLAGQRDKLDGRKRNMCYAFQRGECPHGTNCRFSHNPAHGGKRSKLRAKSGGDGEEEGSKERKERKESGLRKKEGKGKWRNK